MPLVFISRIDSTIPVDLTGLSPNGCRGWSLAQFNTHLVWQGNRQVPLGELFAITGDATSDEWHFAGELRAVHNLGAGMTLGTIVAQGSIGRHAGAGMRGGTLTINGDAGDWLGCELRGGTITVDGSAGDDVGGAYIGSRVGMRGGSIIIQGNVGERAGSAMRRGLLAVGGDAGAWAGYRMRAGSLVVLGSAAGFVGAEMLRGTICVLGNEQPRLLPTFNPASTLALGAIDMLLQSVARRGLVTAAEYAGGEFHLASGDLLYGGRGELVWPKQSS